MLHSFIILDGHPNAFSPTVKTDPQPIDPTQQLPPRPLWANMVESSIDFCRIVWDIQSSKKYLINVFVAGGKPILLNDISEQNITCLMQKFPHAQPRQSYSYDRLQPTLESAFRKFLENDDNNTLQRCRVVLVTVAKSATEKPFEFQNNPNEPPRDLRTMVYESLTNVNKANPSKSLNHVDVNVLRLLPYAESPEYVIPRKIISKQVSSQITMSVYNIPNGQSDLKYAMHHLAQLFYNINVLHISNIPMKSAENTQSTHTVSLYYQANGYHLINQQEPLQNLHIHDPTYLKYREMKLIYSKRSKRTIPESEWCTCMHSISPLKFHDMATEVYLNMSLTGSVSYLVTPEMHHSKGWTHILMSQDGAISLHCLNSQLQQQFLDSENNAIQLSKVKLEGFIHTDNRDGDISKTNELIDTIIRPNLFENIKQYLSATQNDPLCKTVPLDPTRYAHHLPVIHTTLNQKGLLHTSRSIEKATRWRTCFRDCGGTHFFPITYGNDRSIEDLATDVLNGYPLSSGFGLAFGLIYDLFEQLQDIFLKDTILPKEMESTKNLILMMIGELVHGMAGSGKKLFVKGLSNQDAALMSKKLLVALYIIGKRFKSDSENHGQLCDFILLTIKEKTELEASMSEVAPIIKSDDMEHVWDQVNRYENMSLREKEEAAQGIVPEFKQEYHGRAMNPYFKTRRDPRQRYKAPYQQQTLPSNSPTVYPDPSVAVPYLTYISPTLEEKAEEERKEEESLGKPGNLLWLYWMNDKVRKRGIQEEGDFGSGTELVYKDHEWKRVKKEFLGRLAQPGEKGEMI